MQEQQVRCEYKQEHKRNEGGGESPCLYRQINMYVHEHAFVYKIYIYTNIALSENI